MNNLPPIRWPLSSSTFTLADRLAIARQIVSGDQYTMGPRVAELEKRFSEFSGAHALMVANGSVANQLVFELWKLRHPGVKAMVIVPACTWVSSISPILMAGLEVAFCDVNLTDFSFDYDMAERLAENAVAKGYRVILWPTALIGHSPNMLRLASLARKWDADLYLDSCENTFSEVPGEGEHYTDPSGTWGYAPAKRSILASAEMTTTSLYHSHQVTSCEGGLVFFRSKDDHDLGRMLRNHGLTRSLVADHPLRKRVEAENPTVDPEFLFALGGTNLRPTDVHAMFGLRDFARIPAARAHRDRLYRRFHDQLDRRAYYLPPLTDTHSGFCLPIFTLQDNLAQINAALVAAGIQRRPIIGGNLLRQPPFRSYGRPEDFRNAEWIHQRGAYVGLHTGVTDAMVDELTTLLNDLAGTAQLAA